MRQPGDFKDNGFTDKSNLPSDYKKYDTHADHYYTSIQTLEKPNGKQAQSFEGRMFSAIKQASQPLNLNYSNTQIKTQIWNFSGSLIRIDTKTGNRTYKK